MSKVAKNLTEGNVGKQLLIFALPFMLSNIIQSLYNVADMLIVGQFGGPTGISAVNNGGQVTFLMTNLVVGLCAGGTVIIAQYIGSKQNKAVEETIGTLLTTLLLVGIVMTVVMFIIATPILKLIQVPKESFAQTKEYLDITVAGCIFIFGYNGLSAIMRGLGDSKRPLIFVTIACVVNIVLDLILVGYFRLGAKGAAIATITSQALSMVLCIIYLAKNDFPFDFKLKSFGIHKHRLNTLLKIGIPTSVQNVVTNISFLVMTTLVNSISVNASAAVGVVGKFNSFAILPAIAIGSSISAVAAQNIGAGRQDRAKHTMNIGMAMAIGVSLIIFALAQAFPGQILSLFNDDAEMITAGIEYMRVFSFDYIIAPFVFCLTGLITAAGHTKMALLTSLSSSLLIRIPVAIIFGKALDMGLIGIGLGAPVASFVGLIIAAIYIYSGKWKRSTIV